MPDGATEVITVLFVDDEPAILRAILRTLEDAPFAVVAAPGAVEAIATMRERRIDVLVSDIDMPGMTGLELVKLARREFPATLRMLLTGAGTMDRTLDAINEGEVHRFFSKPFDYELFLATMRSLPARIEKLRHDRAHDAQKVRRDEFYAWVEATFPGTLDVARNESGEVEIDPSFDELQLLDELASRA